MHAKNKATHLIVGTSEMLSPHDIYRRKTTHNRDNRPFFRLITWWSYNNPSLFKVLSCCLLRFDKRKTIPRTMSTTTDMCHALKCRKEHHDHDYHSLSTLLSRSYYLHHLLPLATETLAEFQLLSKDERIKNKQQKRILMSHQHQKTPKISLFLLLLRKYCK